MPARQKYRLRARSDREVIREVEPGMTYVDHESGEELKVVGAVLPLAPSPSDLPYSVENLRLCGCSLEQLVQKDLNDCPHCGRRLPAVTACLLLAACGGDDEPKAETDPATVPDLSLPQTEKAEPPATTTKTTP